MAKCGEELTKLTFIHPIQVIVNPVISWQTISKKYKGPALDLAWAKGRKPTSPRPGQQRDCSSSYHGLEH